MRGAAALLALALGAGIASAAGVVGAPDALAAAGARVAAATRALGGTAPADATAALAAALVAHEAALAAVRGAATEAAARERALALDLARRRDEITQLLATMVALGQASPAAPRLHPQGPLGAARAARMLAWTAPALQADADRLAAQLREIDAARTERARAVEALTDGLGDLGAGRDALTAALAAAPPPGALTVAARNVPADVARQADTLSGLAERLATPGAAGDEAGPVTLRWPVTGKVLAAFDARDAAGARRPGLLVEAAPLALVTAPASGRVRYAGPFLDYGYVVVLEPRRDVLVVLAGLATLKAQSGDTVRAGDLLGLLGGRPLDAQEYLMLAQPGSGETPAETLYIELRHGRGPVDPAPWFADR